MSCSCHHFSIYENVHYQLLSFFFVLKSKFMSNNCSTFLFSKYSYSSFINSSMPHGKAIFFPFILVTVSFMMSFRTISSCDLIAARWSIDCSSWYSSQCVFKSTLNLGLLGESLSLYMYFKFCSMRRAHLTHGVLVFS